MYTQYIDNVYFKINILASQSIALDYTYLSVWLEGSN